MCLSNQVQGCLIMQQYIRGTVHEGNSIAKRVYSQVKKEILKK